MDKNLDYIEIENLHKSGLSIKEISVRLGEKYTSIYSHLRRKGLIKLTRDKIDIEVLKDLAAKNLSCAEIARHTGYKEISVYHALKRNNISFHNGKVNFEKELSTIQKNVIIGSLYGDFYLDRSNYSSRISGEHCLKQEDYLMWKLSYLDNIHINISKTNPKPDKRTGKVYKTVAFTTEYNSCFNEFNDIYKSSGKEFDLNLLIKYYNDLSLAIHFMDDGTHNRYTYSLATNSFPTENLKLFQKFLLDRFGLETSIWKSSNVLAIKAKSKKLFESIISPYIHKDMQYKLANRSM